MAQRRRQGPWAPSSSEWNDWDGISGLIGRDEGYHDHPPPTRNYRHEGLYGNSYYDPYGSQHGGPSSSPEYRYYDRPWGGVNEQYDDRSRWYSDRNPSSYSYPDTRRDYDETHRVTASPSRDRALTTVRHTEEWTSPSRRSSSPTYPQERLSPKLKSSPARGPLNCRSPSPPFVPGSPTPSYIEEALRPSAPTPEMARKLLVLDLNGTLVFRKRSNRSISLRPYIAAFARYVTHPGSGLETMVWSSAKPHNVNKMVERCFGESRNDLKAVWGRDTLGLNEEDYNRKVQTVKDLKIVWQGLPDHQFSASSTILLDDSALKAHMQPYNHIVLREYDGALWERDQRILFKERGGGSSDGALDQTLVAVIGILHEAVRYDNVASWIRSGGLWAGLRNISALPAGTASAGNGEKAPALAQPNTQEWGGAGGAMEAVPSTEVLDGNIWFKQDDVLQAWITRGLTALKELGIPHHPSYDP